MSRVKLDSFQKAAIERTSVGDNVILAGPTGCGKTEIAAGIIAANPNKHCLFLAHLNVLTDNAADRFGKRLGLPVGKLYAGKASYERVVVANIRTVAAMANLPPFHTIIADECHWNEQEDFMRVLGVYMTRGTQIIGLTATPWDAHGKRLNSVYTDVHTVALHSQMIAIGRLVPARMLTVSRKGIADTVKEILKHARDKRTVVFCTDIAAAEAFCARFTAHGIRAGVISSDHSAQHNETTSKAFRTGAITHLCNVAMVTEGYDLPELECVVIARPVGSYRLWTQMIGRVLRASPGKTYGLVLDCYGTESIYSTPDIDIDYSRDLRPSVTGMDDTRPYFPGEANDNSKEQKAQELLKLQEERRAYQIAQAVKLSEKEKADAKALTAEIAMVKEARRIQTVVAEHLLLPMMESPSAAAERIGVNESVVYNTIATFKKNPTFRLFATGEQRPGINGITRPSNSKLTPEQRDLMMAFVKAWVARPSDQALSQILGLSRSAVQQIRRNKSTIEGFCIGRGIKASNLNTHYPVTQTEYPAIWAYMQLQKKDK